MPAGLSVVVLDARDVESRRPARRRRPRWPAPCARRGCRRCDPRCPRARRSAATAGLPAGRGSQNESHGQYIVAYAERELGLLLDPLAHLLRVETLGVSRIAMRSFIVSQCSISAFCTALNPSGSIWPPRRRPSGRAGRPSSRRRARRARRCRTARRRRRCSRRASAGPAATRHRRAPPRRAGDPLDDRRATDLAELYQRGPLQRGDQVVAALARADPLEALDRVAALDDEREHLLGLAPPARPPAAAPARAWAPRHGSRHRPSPAPGLDAVDGLPGLQRAGRAPAPARAPSSGSAPMRAM